MGERTLLSSQHPPPRLRHHLLDQGHKAVDGVGKSPGGALAGLCRPLTHSLDLLQACLGNLQQLAIGRLPRPPGGPFTLTRRFANLSGQSLGATRTIAENGACLPHLISDELPGSSNQTAEHTSTVTQQAAIAGIGDVGLNDGAVCAQLASSSHLQMPGQDDDTGIELLQSLWTNEAGPADEGSIVGCWLQVESAELAQNQAIRDEPLSLLVAPVIESSSPPADTLL